MSLRKQLMLTIIGLFLVVMIGTYALAISNLRNYLVENLENQAQNTASSLGVTLSQQNKEDLPRMQAILGAAFNTGNYQRIAVIDLKDKLVIERKQDIMAELYPTWFGKLLPINPAPARELVMAGWTQYGVVEVVPETKLAHARLWQHFVVMFWWFVGITLVVLTAGIFALRFILEPINRVTKQANDIANRNFYVQENVPKAPELRSVVLAMNHLSNKVSRFFDEQATLIEKLRLESYQDSVTQLGNRRYLMMQLENLIHSEEEFHHGALYLIEFKELKTYKAEYGFEALDNYLKRLASVLNELCTDNDFSTYRISDTAFALLASDISDDALTQLAKTLSEQLQELHANLGNDVLQCHIGVAAYSKGMTANELLSSADMAHQVAESKTNYAWNFYKPDLKHEQEIMSAMEWQHFLYKAIADGNILLHYQPIVVQCDGEDIIHHHEVFIRIPDSCGGLLHAGLFIPIAENLGLMPRLDQLVIEKVMQKIANGALDNQRFSINISPSSLGNPEFIQFIENQLRADSGFAKQLILELPEQSLSLDNTELAELINKLQALGCEFCLDHFGRGLTSVKYLKTLRVNYLKLDGSYTRQIQSDQANQFFIHVVSELAHNFDIKIIAQNVETEQQLEKLKDLHIDGFQGYLLGKPSEDI